MLQGLLDQTAARYDVPGAAIAVGHGDELLEAATGVLNRDTGVAATPDSVYQIGSVTKVWTAALVLQLVDDGLIGLDDPVRRHLPEFAVVDAHASETVTVRQLLLHTGGFDGDLFTDTGRGDDALDRFLAHLGGHAQQVTAPGTLYSYCNAGYSVLGALVARLRGGTWESVLRERLIEPLGARHMALFAEEAVLFRASAGHMHAGNTVARPWQMARSQAPAGATTCAAPRDLVRLGQMLLAGGRTQAGERLLSAEAVAAMTSPQLTLPGPAVRGGGRRGLGPELFAWDGEAAYGHDGLTIGQFTMWRVVPAHRLVVAIHANGGAAPGFLDAVLDAVVQRWTGLTVPPRPTPPAGPYAPVPSAYAGRYEYPMARYDVGVSGDGLEVTTTPLGFAAEWDEPVTTHRYVPLDGATFVGTEPVDGRHPMLTFLQDGRYVYGGRVARRIP
ncbi:serine hydrolase domain-containing protein [Actinoplanes sp. URMC 104]|uniref:serine hydrolase domain-containing protein n=1 Tax=Actinoplanes sp. URMC 104 TaxID=3423409 RepID=UPI003F19A4E3